MVSKKRHLTVKSIHISWGLFPLFLIFNLIVFIISVGVSCTHVEVREYLSVLCFHISEDQTQVRFLGLHVNAFTS